MHILQAFIYQSILFMVGVLACDAQNYSPPKESYIIIIFLWFVLGTWARYYYSWPLLGVWAYII